MGTRVLSLAALAVVLLPRDAADLYFNPADGLVLERSIEISGAIDLDDAEFTVMGQTMGPESLGGRFANASAEMRLWVTHRDEYEHSERGQTLGLVRHLGEAVFNGESLPDEGPRAVRFTFDPSAGQAVASLLEDSDEDPEDEQVQRVLTVMREPVDPSFLLPDQPVEPGAAWEVELGMQELMDLMLPGLDLDRAVELGQSLAEEEMAKAPEKDQAAMAQRLMTDLTSQLRSGFKRPVAKVHLAAIDTEGGTRLARMPFEFEFSLDLDPSQVILEAMKEAEDAPELLNFNLEIQLEVQVSGELVWDLDGHYSRELHLEGDYNADINGSAIVKMDEMGEMPFEGLIAFSGNFESTHLSAPPVPAEPAAD